MEIYWSVDPDGWSRMREDEIRVYTVRSCSTSWSNAMGTVTLSPIFIWERLMEYMKYVWLRRRRWRGKTSQFVGPTEGTLSRWPLSATYYVILLDFRSSMMTSVPMRLCTSEPVHNAQWVIVAFIGNMHETIAGEMVETLTCVSCHLIGDWWKLCQWIAVRCIVGACQIEIFQSN